MKIKWKKLWTKALRSGKFKQANDCLKDSKGYCCLGVLIRVVAPTAKWEGNPDIGFKFKGDQCYPPADLLARIGLKRNSARHLADMNDNGRTFEEIAKEISKRY